MNNYNENAALHYDGTLRVLHWLMAFLFVFMFASAALRYFFLDSALDKFIWPVHKPIGTLLFVLVAIRLCWRVIRKHYRPPSVSTLAAVGHWLLYALMLLIPLLGLLRQYGSGRAFSVLGVPLFDERVDDKIQWLIDLGTMFHGLLGWILAVLICGHIAALIIHHRRGDTWILRRMLSTIKRN